MASFLDFLSGGQGGGILGNRPFYPPQADPAAQQQQASQGGGFLSGLGNYANNNSNVLMALGGGLASGGIGGGFQAAAKAGEAEQMQRLALAHFLQQKSQFEQELAMKKHLTSPEYLGQTEEQKAKIAQQYQNPIAMGPGASLFKPGPPGQEGKIVATNETGLLSDDEATALAHQVKAGDITPLQQQGYGAMGAVNRAKINKAVVALRAGEGISGEQAAAKRIEYAAETAGARSTAQREVAVQTPAAEFKRMAPIAVEASEALNRSDYPNLNAITNAVQKGVGGEQVVKAHTALTSVGNIYARAISPTGQSTDATRATAYGLLNEALAKGQVKATVDMMQREIAAAESGVKDVQAERLRNFLGKQGINVPPPVAPPAQAAPAGATQAPQVAPSGPQEGDIAVNRSTGQRMQLKGGKWMPAPQPGQQQL